MRLPDIKKTLSDFLSCEEGKISKKVVVGLGVAIATVGMAASAQQSITSIEYQQGQIIGKHMIVGACAYGICVGPCGGAHCGACSDGGACPGPGPGWGSCGCH